MDLAEIGEQGTWFEKGEETAKRFDLGSFFQVSAQEKTNLVELERILISIACFDRHPN